ncbi:FAD-dependent monooxygenase [Kitasatospora gansuensis]
MGGKGMRNVLISGAGIAGPTLAYWLARHGFRPTVVEPAPAARPGGSPVDVRGPALRVAERMGVLPQLRAAGTGVTSLRFVDAAGRQVGRVATGGRRGAGEVELPRGDLAALLSEAAREHAEFLFGDSISTLAQDADGVDVTFEHAPPRRFDLVIGADGLHSRVRRLAFGPERVHVRHLGMYVATVPLLSGPDDPADGVRMYNAPGRAAAVHPGRGRSLGFFAFRHPEVTDLHHRDLAGQRRLLGAAYAEDERTGAWRLPELLDRARTADEFYFDAVAQVRLDTWSHGRIGLLGDAASAVSLFGDGSSLALAGAHTLATALADHTEPTTALHHYETTHRRLVDPRQRNVLRAAALLVPRTSRGLRTRNLATHLLPSGG